MQSMFITKIIWVLLLQQVRLDYVSGSQTCIGIKNRCIQCRKNSKLLQSQVMSQLPQERLKAAPAWSFTSSDFFGPFEIRGETNKRSRGTAYGVLFTCMLCRVVHLDLATDYSTNGFLIVLRRFMSLRGYHQD